MTALRYFPGQVIVFGTTSLQQDFEDSSISSFGELLASNSYRLRSGSYFLELFVVNSGEELRFLEIARHQPGVIVASLNYIGFGMTGRYVDDDPPQELIYQPGVPHMRDMRYYFLNEADGAIDELEFEDLIDRLREWENDEDEQKESVRLVAAVDVDPEHCQEVMGLIAEGMSHDDADPQAALEPFAAIIGLTSSIDGTTITDLYGFNDRLLRLAEFTGQYVESGEESAENGTTGTQEEAEDKIDARVIAINMSVDFSQVILGYNDLRPEFTESPDTVFSIPGFEMPLAHVVSDLTRAGRSPAVFAAAGNRLEPGGKTRVRLGYPATRPEVIAASLVTPDETVQDGVQPVDWVDVPATTGLKPCFAIDVARIRLSNSNGSSFASAWLAGYYTTLAHEYQKGADDVSRLGLLSKVAWLMRRTERGQLPSGRYRLPCYAAVVRGSRTDEFWDENSLIHDLCTAFNADFCLFGSSAAVSEWLRLNRCDLRDLDPWIHKDLGDVDLLYAGFIKDEDMDKIKAFVRDWYRERFGRSWVVDRKRPVQLHTYESSVNAGERLRAVTPVNKLYITTGGVIDTWGGLADLERRSIRFFPLTHPAFWARNNLYCTGADSLALNIVQWISIVALLQLVSCAAGVIPPEPDPESVSAVTQIFDDQEKTDAGDGASPLNMFGRERADGPIDLRERLDRRLERVETLMGTCARHQMVDTTLDLILKRLLHIRAKTKS